MVARLAFAVCAHADADVMIVDEALSVGDGAFAEKCDDFIQDYAKHGTILIVSHDLFTLETLCDRVLWIEDGYVRMIGAAAEVLDAYASVTQTKPPVTAKPRTARVAMR